MKKFLLVLFLALPVFAQTKESLEQRTSPKPSGTAGDIPYAVNTTTIGWIAHATGTKCLQQVGSATPTWATCGGASPLTTKGDIFVFSTVDARLPVGTNGYVLESDSTQTTGLKWVDPNAASTGWVKLQSSFPGSQQIGSFNVDGSSGSGPYLITYPPTVSASTYDIFTITPNASSTVHDRYRIMFGDSASTAKQLSFSYYAPSSGGGEVASWNLTRSDKNYGAGITLMQKNSALNMILCLATDSSAGSAYPTVCDTAGGAALAIGVTGGAAATTVNNDGNIALIRGVAYGWPTSAPAGVACLRYNPGTGNLSWDTTCGTGATGGVSSVALALPSEFTISGSPVTSTGTLTGAWVSASGNKVIASPAGGGSGAYAGRALVSLDIPNNAADTTGKSAKTDALNTTTTAVDVAGSTAPPGSGYSLVTTNSTHATWQAVGTGTVTSIATTAPITGGTITSTGTIAISDCVASGASHARGAVPDTPAVAGTLKYLREDCTWASPSGGTGTPYSGTVWIESDPNFATGSSYERVQTSYLGGNSGLVALKPARTYATAVANAKTSPSSPWAWNNTTHVVSADENTTTASALFVSWDVTNNYDWVSGTTTASTLTKSYYGNYQEWIFRIASADYTTTAKGSGFLVYSARTSNQFFRVFMGGSSGTVGSIAFFDGSLSNSVATTQTQNTNGIWIRIVRSGNNVTGWYNLTNQATPPTTWSAGGGGISLVDTGPVLAGWAANRFNSTGNHRLSILYFDDTRTNMAPSWEATNNPVTAAQGFDSTSPVLTLVSGFNLGTSGVTVANADVQSALTEITNPREFDLATWTWSVSRGSSAPVACGGGSYAAAASVTVGGSGQYISVCGKAASSGSLQPGSVSSQGLRIPATP